jgi:hypothetical protein
MVLDEQGVRMLMEQPHVFFVIIHERDSEGRTSRQQGKFSRMKVVYVSRKLKRTGVVLIRR